MNRITKAPTVRLGALSSNRSNKNGTFRSDLRCTACGSEQNKVVDSRGDLAASYIRRRRECLRCGYRFTSYEIVSDERLLPVDMRNRMHRHGDFLIITK